jgi:hypothetical protein
VPVLESSALPANTATLDLETRARQLPTDKELLEGVIPMPRDCNANGAFWRLVMAQVDLAGAVMLASLCRWSHCNRGRQPFISRAGTSSSFCHRRCRSATPISAGRGVC